MALTIAFRNTPYVEVVGNKRRVVADVTFDSSYPTGGESLTPADLGLYRIDDAVCNIEAVGGTVNVASVWYDNTNQKLKVYDETPGEVADTATLATLVVQVAATGK